MKVLGLFSVALLSLVTAAQPQNRPPRLTIPPVANGGIDIVPDRIARNTVEDLYTADVGHQRLDKLFPDRSVAEAADSAAANFGRNGGPAAMSRFSMLPLVFEPNVGQADPRISFLARGPGYTLLLNARETIMSSRNGTPLRMRLVGANKSASGEPLEPTGGVSNYYLGNQPARWRTNVPQYRSVRYRGVYAGVDQVFYGIAGRMEFDLVVAPGANAGQIEIEYEGARSVRFDGKGDLLLATQAGDIRMHRPKVYQTDANGGRLAIGAAFRLNGPRSARFLLARYDTRRELVIDPSVEYATYLGGASNDEGNGIAVDSSGNAYVAGITGSSDFPTLSPSVNKSFGGGTSDAFVTKINPGGTALIYSTYIGGSSADQANAVAVDAMGNAYVTGMTQSKNFPVQNPFQLALKSATGNAFVVKLGVTGSLIYSTYLGGSNTAHGDAGNAYVAGRTSSSDFPTRDPLQSLKGAENAFVTEISPDGSALVYSTFLGGGSPGSADFAATIAVDSSGNAYIAGQAGSTNFPVTNSISKPSSQIGVFLAFVTKLNAGGSAIVYSTLLGGKSNGAGTGTSAKGIAVDASGDAYVTGTTTSTQYPTANPLYTSGGAFVSKLNPAGDTLLFSTYFPGCALSAITVDAAANAYVTGTANYLSVSQFPRKNALQPNLLQNISAVVTAFSSDGSSLIYSTLLGGDANGNAIVSDAAGDVYVTGFGLNMPADKSAFQTASKGYPDAFIFAYSSAAGPSVTTVNAASVAAGAPVALNSIASAFGVHLGTQTASASGTLGTTLGGTTVKITDSAATTLPAELFYSSAGQVNLLIPQTLATGQGQIEITAGDGTISVGSLQLAAVAPGIFTADGKLAVGSALKIDAQGNQTTQELVAVNSAGQFVAVPISLGASTYLTLYGTGLRYALKSQFSVSIGGQTVAPTYAGMQGAYAGLDQLNIPVPDSLAGAGDVAIVLTAAGATSNAVHVTIQ